MAESTALTPDPEDIADAIGEASQVLIGELFAALAAVHPDLNLTHLRVLVALERRGPMRLADIADTLDVTPTTVTRLADRLSGLGLVDRVRQSDDRREVLLTLSSRGAKTVSAIADRRRELVARHLSLCSASDQRAALRVLSHLAGPLSRPDAATA